MTPQSFLAQLADLAQMQLTNWRWSWRSVVLTSIVAPVISIVGLGVFAAGSGPETLGYVLTGNLVMSLLFSTVGSVSSNFSYMRTVGTLDYFATLPVHRVGLILATVGAFFVFALPPVAVTLLLGALALRLTITLSPWLLLFLPLISVTLSGLGALIGVTARTPEEQGSISTLATFLMVAIGPVIVPASRLPEFVTILSLVSPATYAASALRQLVLGMPDRIPLVVDGLALLAFAAGLLWLAARRMDWRQT